MFDGDTVLKADDLVAVLEAARWAATWGHRQPVRFMVGLRGDETFTTDHRAAQARQPLRPGRRSR